MFNDMIHLSFTDSLDSDVLRTYIQKYSPVYPEVERRITFQTGSDTSGAATLSASIIYSEKVFLWAFLMTRVRLDL